MEMRGVRWGWAVALGLSGLLIAALLVGFLPLGHWGVKGFAPCWGLSRAWLGSWGWLFMVLTWLMPLGLVALLVLCLVELTRAVLPGRKSPAIPALPGGPCPKCGHPTQTNWHNCPYCGHILQ